MVDFFFSNCRQLILLHYSAKELEHFERIRQSFESSTTKESDSQVQPRTIAEAIGGLSPGEEIVVDGGSVVNGEHSFVHRGTGARPPGTVGKGKNNRSTHSNVGKGKSKSTANGIEADSDSSFDGYQPSLRSESNHSHSYDVGEESDDDGIKDGDADADDYVVRTDHLQTEHDDVD